MKNQALFSFRHKSKKSKCCLLQFLFGALRVKIYMQWNLKFGQSNEKFFIREKKNFTVFICL